jgi:hypothetical protein
MDSRSHIDQRGGAVTPKTILRIQGENVLSMHAIVQDERLSLADRMAASSRLTQAVHAWTNAYREHVSDERMCELEAEVYRGRQNGVEARTVRTFHDMEGK